jgi:V/A-type H+-transporting ATPase subunit E
MSIEKITSRIMDEAERERQQVVAEAEKKRDAILADARAKAEALQAAEEARGLSEKEKTVSRRKSVADIDCRKMILQEKQQHISQCFDRAVDAIIGMEEDSYLSLLISLGQQTGLKEGMLIFNEKEKASIGQKVADGLTKAVPEGKFTVSEETRNIRGGYLLEAGKVYINNTIEALVEEYKDSLSSEIAAMLFEKQ